MPIAYPIIELKRCGRCQERKALECFGKVKGKPRSYCKECHKAANLVPDLRTEKECSCCKQTKSVSEFTRQGKRYYSVCKECTCGKSNIRRAEERDAGLNIEINRDNYRKYRKWRKLKSVYGITKEQYEAMVLQQENKCAICKKEEKEKDGQRGTTLNLSVDHDHKTGKVRGLLCRQCNIGIGRLQESVEVLQSAIDYLRIHSVKE